MSRKYTPEEEKWIAAYNAALQSPDAFAFRERMVDLSSRAGGHYAMWGHWVTDPFIATCLICGKEW